MNVNPFRELTKVERIIWFGSLLVITVSFLIFSSDDYLTLIASLIGVTALIFVAKGFVIGQVLTVVFAIFYGIISFYFKYYGEMITYLGMTAPIAMLTVVEWIKHPFEESAEVKVNNMTGKQTCAMLVAAAIVTIGFHIILVRMENANIVFSTVSVTTSFVASFLTLKRSPYYALAYAANDVVLIILWGLASAENISYIAMVICFMLFFINDMYGFFNWRNMQKRQAE